MLRQLAGIRLASEALARTIVRGRSMRRTLGAISLASLALTMAFASSAAEPAATFRIIPDHVITQKFVGFGGQMNPYLWCRPNAEPPAEAGGPVKRDDINDLEQKILALAPQHVRIFVLPHWWDGRPDDVSHGDPRTKDSFIRTVQLAQRAGATVNLTLWYGPYPDPQRTGAQFAEILDQ